MSLFALPRLPQWLQLPVHCLLCGQSCAVDGAAICPACFAELPWLGPHCVQCALPLSRPGLRCGTCQKQPPSFDQVIAPWRYAFPVDSLISRFKHQAKLPLGHLLAQLLREHLHQRFSQGLSKPDTLLPVPLAPLRQRQRGFNQAELLGRWLAPQLGITLHQHWLTRLVETPAQQQLDAATRKRNLRGAFALSAASQVKNRHIALLDDVLTTGATAQSLALLLKRSGAARVDVYCLARTPSPGA
ncbi:ComF family protein [Pseudomonas sp. 5P_3.1_Bac2]|uniref:ComF family protein n=1 Tax=Pseudomonas sp. 5P_3.1_Bac2 TaxID=2971617 RepID=UPI0021C8EFB8|nr:ComF family protein [Pseudomonas sp. 5P_3.1_Bac2]MCU1717776.1 ComF family protein [Pseudomonas sp. 5P_3.1_Bac2]